MKGIKNLLKRMKNFFKKEQVKRHFLIHAYLYKKGVLFDDVVLHTAVDIYPNKATITTNIAAKYSEFGIDKVKVDIPVEVSEAEAISWVTIPDWYTDALKKQQQSKKTTRNQRRKNSRSKSQNTKTVNS